MTRTRQARPVAIIVIVLGLVMMTTTIASATRNALRVASITTEVFTQPAGSDMTKLDAQVAAAELQIEFTSNSQAELEVTGPNGGRGWKLQRLGSTLSVTAPSAAEQLSVGWRWGRDGDKAVLRLPAALRAGDDMLDASLAVSAGSLRVNGSFDSLNVSVEGGSAALQGSATHLAASVDTGSMDMTLADVNTANLTVDTGSMSGTFAGQQPSDVTIDIDSGSGNLKLPPGTYAVTSTVDFGDLANELQVSADSKHKVDVSVDTGSLSIKT